MKMGTDPIYILTTLCGWQAISAYTGAKQQKNGFVSDLINLWKKAVSYSSLFTQTETKIL